MSKNKIYDCVTFFDENLLTNLRFEVLNEVVDYFIVCESKYDHKNREKKINFKLLNKSFENKVRHIVIDKPFPSNLDFWQIEEYQREKIIESIKDAMDDDYIIYSDSDEIPNPALLKEINLKKKYGIFLQDFYVYNFDTFNHYETPWDGSKICKKRNLKSITYLRKKIKSSNLKKSLWKIFIPKSIQLYNQGGWHFNNFYSPEKISLKLKTFQHTEFADEKFSNVEVIKDKIQKLIDLFERGHRYKKIKNNKKIPQKILNLYNNIKKNTE
tara:strand:+ start:1612 stop:2421 length:810 start_codon:yes stop_codon:yes gene_type:complete